MIINKRKIALCLSGQPRYIVDGYKDIKKHLLDKYDVDVFIHTWFDNDMLGKKFDFSPNNTYGRTGILLPNTIEIIGDIYKPLGFEYEGQKHFDMYSDVNYEKQSPISMYSMYYSILKANDLKKKQEQNCGVKYDLVIRCRFDIVFNTFNINLETIDDSFIWVSGEIEPYPNDQFAVSSSENMDYYSNLYNMINDYYIKGYRSFVNERILKHHLIDVGGKKIHYTNNNELLCNIIKK